MEPAPTTTPAARPWWRDELLAGCELAGLIGFAVAQPVLGPFGESPETFMAAGASDGDIVRFALASVLLPLLALWVPAALSRLLGHRVRQGVQVVLLAGLAALAATATVRDLGSSGFSFGEPARIAAAVLAPAVVAVLHLRWAAFRSFLRFTVVVPVALVATFLYASPVGTELRPALQTLEASMRSTTASAPPETATGAAATSVVVVVFDELPTMSLTANGEIDADLFPSFAELAATSTWYRNHTTMGPATGVAVPSIVTGQLPPGYDFGALTEESLPDNLLSLLAPTHRLNAVEWASTLCPPGRCPSDEVRYDDELRDLAPVLGAAGGFDVPSPFRIVADDAVSRWWTQVWPTAEPREQEATEPAMESAPQRVRPPLEFLARLGPDDDGPVLDYLHAPVPHVPWTLLPDGHGYNGPIWSAGFFDWPGGRYGEAFTATTHTRHLLQLQWSDRVLGTVIDRLQAHGRWDDSLVVVTSDHGVAFGAGESPRTLTRGNETEIAWTPLLVKLPGQTTGVVDDRNALGIDVLPTIADVLGLDIGWDVDGRSLLGEPRLDAVKPIREPQYVHHPDAQDGFVELDPAGFFEVIGWPGLPGEPGDELRPWRYGRHGELIGEEVSAIGTCGDGPHADYEPPDDWDEYIAGGAAAVPLVPLWHEGTVEGDELDVALAVDGVVAGWGRSQDGQFEVLVAEPVVGSGPGRVTLYEISSSECLRPLRTG